jgi:hypothetical protein
MSRRMLGVIEGKPESTTRIKPYDQTRQFSIGFEGSQQVRAANGLRPRSRLLGMWLFGGFPHSENPVSLELKRTTLPAGIDV